MFIRAYKMCVSYLRPTDNSDLYARTNYTVTQTNADRCDLPLS